ncbi:hypothetical protein YUYDRAFT_04023 [Streptomyces sp. ScaeMP-e48]|uniref:hypothetical protein n=1 Tax=Streptomyces sp. ScaeMP-e48 TaxID=1100823 RepID=UPI000823EAB9|nr:hypothetical protein [Streptomyces sp. ScaeMP-e48]SCK34211.1 hypothetical protein YUYDRAFT_04023 [Streptomyces sp. ScaeMP-e48]
MNEDQEFCARAVDLAARTLAALYTNDELANHPAAITDDVLSLAPYVADYIKSGEFDRQSLLRHCPGGDLNRRPV